MKTIAAQKRAGAPEPAPKATAQSAAEVAPAKKTKSAKPKAAAKPKARTKKSKE
jgi:hypothetical protein